MNKLLVISLALVVFLSGCITTEKETDLEKIKGYCISACEAERKNGIDLSNGPCLLNPMPENPDWVCDVAHDPRQSADDLPENQCSAFRESISHHFVEVTPECNFIRAW